MKQGKKVYTLLQFTNGNEYSLRVFSTKKSLYEYVMIWSNLSKVSYSKNRFYKDMDSREGAEWNYTVHHKPLTDDDLAFNGLSRSDVSPKELYGGSDLFDYTAKTKYLD